MRILAIETSCDETALAFVEASGDLHTPKFEIKKNLIASQIETHRPWGGVVPNLAKRDHLENLPKLFEKLGEVDPERIAITIGPGLEPCLWTGINFTQELTKKYPKAETIGTNHLHGHMYSFLLTEQKVAFPAVQLIVSGGHTILILMKSLTNYRKLGETRDDATGEAFDKVARMIGLPYPGGPEIEKLANYGNPVSIDFPRPMIHEKNYDFSFSGLKTAVFYHIKKKKLSEEAKRNIAASFQQAAIDTLTTKTIKAAQEFEAKTILLSGGVAANSALRETLQTEAKKIGATFCSAPIKYQGDNAVMIAIAGYLTHLQNKKFPLEANGNLGI
jgi:N6-L-threonylcarbamoyladenine synthase